ncbi:MAG: DUF58 domain-containing protein [Candidatus Schekmanbacteria bacterium]|nr:MAG: DUF58 domain-containing protein [Candidatus Schekmanbacteria bacterium]
MFGHYKSAFHGKGIEFTQVREYVPGDDIRLIDWNVSARVGNIHIKEFQEERELNLLLAVDLSASGSFGSGIQLKREIAAEIAALFAYLAIRSNDRIGLMIFTNEVELFIPPKKGPVNVWRIVREVLSLEPKNSGTDMGSALNFLNRALKRRTICFLISDFMCEDFEKELKLSSKKHEIVAVSVRDRREFEIPNIDFAYFEDAETGETVVVNTRDREFRDYMKNKAEKLYREKLTLFSKNNIDCIEVWTDKPYIYPVLNYFKSKEKKR